MSVIKAEYNESASTGLLTFSNGNKHTVGIRDRTQQEFAQDIAQGYLDRFELYPSDTVEQVAEFYQFGAITVTVFESEE